MTGDWERFAASRILWMVWSIGTGRPAWKASVL